MYGCTSSTRSALRDLNRNARTVWHRDPFLGCSSEGTEDGVCDAIMSARLPPCRKMWQFHHLTKSLLIQETRLPVTDQHSQGGPCLCTATPIHLLKRRSHTVLPRHIFSCLAHGCALIHNTYSVYLNHTQKKALSCIIWVRQENRQRWV